jgi:hypothetical protein
MNVLRGCKSLLPRLFSPTFSRFFCSSAEHTKLDGFNQVLRISFQTAPAATSVFETVVSKFVGNCFQSESDHLEKLDVMKQQNKPSNFTILQVHS